MARQAEERENPPEPEVLEEEAEEEDVLLAAVEEDEAVEGEAAEYVDADEELDEVYAAPTPRRMKFRREGAAA
jgi:hypothetical protein